MRQLFCQTRCSGARNHEAHLSGLFLKQDTKWLSRPIHVRQPGTVDTSRWMIRIHSAGVILHVQRRRSLGRHRLHLSSPFLSTQGRIDSTLACQELSQILEFLSKSVVTHGVCYITEWVPRRLGRMETIKLNCLPLGLIALCAVPGEFHLYRLNKPSGV
ncbi:hypothetical protein BJX68DRAFT_158822 [Aspergillus pseudodeflectus]|uniref:Uncharacterized protein n=1 Tax=Aspergillus pseudodeflectus TaxID=176178 RepID=A0ABR4JS53_9EURO